jgi:hypothetical protein
MLASLVMLFVAHEAYGLCIGPTEGNIDWVHQENT